MLYFYILIGVHVSLEGWFVFKDIDIKMIRIRIDKK